MPLAAACLALLALPYAAGTWLPAGLSDALILCLIIITLLWQTVKFTRSFCADKNNPQSRERRSDNAVRIDTDGEYWHEYEPGRISRMHIRRSRCRVFPFALYLAFTRESGAHCYRWVLPDECEPLYYRRLVRLIVAS